MVVEDEVVPATATAVALTAALGWAAAGAAEWPTASVDTTDGAGVLCAVGAVVSGALTSAAVGFVIWGAEVAAG